MLNAEEVIALKREIESQNYYERLGLTPAATNEDIKKAYRDLAKNIIQIGRKPQGMAKYLL